MAQSFLEVTSIEISRAPGASVCTFAVVLDGPGGVCRLEGVPAEDVLSYDRLQRRILERAGVLWMHTSIQGRGAEAAGVQWGHLLNLLLVDAQPATVVDGPLN